MVTLHPVNESDIVRILTEPKNALVKQYQKFFGLDNVELVFEPDSLCAIADRAVDRGTGARALKSIIEEALLDAMYEIPSRPEIKRCTITRATIDGESRAPVYELHDSNTVAVIKESA